MNEGEKSAATVEELLTLTKDTNAKRIVVRGDLVNMPSFRLAPGPPRQRSPRTARAASAS